MLPFLGRLGTRNCLMLVIIPMLAITVGLKVAFHFIPPPRPNMLPKADGMVETPSVEDAQPHTTMTITMPNDLLGSEVFAVGTYVEGGTGLPVGSVAINLTKNDWRFVEIIERPNMALDDAVDLYAFSSEQDVALGDNAGKLLTLNTRGISCVDPNAQWSLPGFCEIPELLVFQSRGITFTIGADDSHATVGELISMAKDILAQ